MLALYIAVFLVGFMLADLQAMALLELGGLRIYGIDLFHLAAAIATCAWIAAGGWRKLTRGGRVYVVFLGSLILALGHGAVIFGARAFGEFRYVAPLFWFFVPLAVEGQRKTQSGVEGATLTMNCLWALTAAAVCMLSIELATGGRFYLVEANRELTGGFVDFRGVRLLDSYQTLSLVLGAVALGVAASDGLIRPKLAYAGSIILGALALLTRNRASVLAVLATVVVLAAVERRVRGIAVAGAVGITLLATLAAASQFVREQLTLAFGSVLMPTQDETGLWRLTVQAAAVDQALETPYFGAGYGGYFNFMVPGSEPVIVPPHNQFLSLFLKGGALATGLGILAVVAYSNQIWVVRKSTAISAAERWAMRTVLVLVASQMLYGFAYDFVVYLGLFVGLAEIIAQRERERRVDAATPSVGLATPLTAS